MAMLAPPTAHVPSRGMAKFAVYIRCSMKGWADPEIGSVTKDA